MMPYANKCLHDFEKKCFCRDCGFFMCSQCSMEHNCPNMKKKVIEYIDESLFSNFKFEKFLGKGSYGSVFKVLNLLDNQIYALKIIEEVDKDSFQKVKLEVELMTKIKYPNIVTFI